MMDCMNACKSLFCCCLAQQTQKVFTNIQQDADPPKLQGEQIPSLWISPQGIKNMEESKIEERNWERKSWITFKALSLIPFTVLGKSISFWMSVCNIGPVFQVILADFKQRITSAL